LWLYHHIFENHARRAAMILKTGIDLIEIPRVQKTLERYGGRFLKRVFTEAEVFESRSRADGLALHFAGKEATAKALGTGIGSVAWRDVEVLHKWSGEPYVVLHGAALLEAEQQGLTEFAISLSHSREMATAVVVAMGEKKAA
jgi:holo-[acyl-carrier protein] synthase